MSSNLLIFCSVISNLLLIPSSVFFTQNIVFFIFKNGLGSFLYHPCLYIICLIFTYFLDIWNIVIKIILVSLSTNSSICTISLLIMGYIFLLLCMPVNFLLDAKHCEFYLIGCWTFLYSYKYSWTLFWDSVNLPGMLWSVRGLLFSFLKQEQNSLIQLFYKTKII